MEKLNKIEQQPRNEALEKAMSSFYNYLNLRDKPSRSNAIFVLGGSSLAPVEKAIQLYKQGFAPKISFISVGGKFGGDKVWGMPEDKKYREILLEAGVPEADIVSEGLTTNTLVESQQAIPFMEGKGINPEKLILVSRPIHQRRAYSTFAKQWPNVEYVNCPADEPLDFYDPETQERLVQEAERLLDYSKKGDIKIPEIPMDLLRDAVTIRNELKDKGIYNPRIKPQPQK